MTVEQNTAVGGCSSEELLLASGFDGAVHRALVRTNWIRTAAWSLRGALAIAIAAQA